MIAVGGDARKGNHTLVAVDPIGKRLGTLTLEARAGHERILDWLAGFGEVTVAAPRPSPSGSSTSWARCSS